MLLSIHPENPEGRKIAQAVEILRAGGVIIYPTDTVYGFGCDITQPDAVDRICRIRGLDPKKANMTFMCSDISQIQHYAYQIDNVTFRIINRQLPGPYTFILKSNHQVPNMFKNRKRTIGVRLSGHPVVQALVEELGRPILSTSLKSDDDILEYHTDPSIVHDELGRQVDLVIDSGAGGNEPSTVIDCTGPEPELIRQGAGEWPFN